jgi:cytochrome c1
MTEMPRAFVILVLLLVPASAFAQSQTVVGSFVVPLSETLGGTGCTTTNCVAAASAGTNEKITGTGTQSIAANISFWSPSVCADATLNLPANPIDQELHVITNGGACPSNAMTVAGNGHNLFYAGGSAASVVSVTPGVVTLRYSVAGGSIWIQQ